MKKVYKKQKVKKNIFSWYMLKRATRNVLMIANIKVINSRNVWVCVDSVIHFQNIAATSENLWQISLFSCHSRGSTRLPYHASQMNQFSPISSPLICMISELISIQTLHHIYQQPEHMCIEATFHLAAQRARGCCWHDLLQWWVLQRRRERVGRE